MEQHKATSKILDRPGGIHSRGQRRRILAVRAMAGETAWLDGRLLWHEGRVIWEISGGRRGFLAPNVGDIALAQRRLNQIRRYPIAAKRALGDADGWLARRSARLELAKRLCAVTAPDLTDLVASAQRPHTLEGPQIARLAVLLVAEATCANVLPASPSRALIACGQRAESYLSSLVEDGDAPISGRALALLALGATHRGRARAGDEVKLSIALSAFNVPWLQRTYAWGLRFGVSADPALLVKLLAHADGMSLARRYISSTSPANPFQLPAAMLHELLGEGVSPDDVVALAEAATDAGSLADRLMAYRHLLPERLGPRRREAAERLEEQRREAVTDMVQLIHEYARSTSDPLAVRAATRLTHLLLDFAPITRELIYCAYHVLKSGLSLPPALRRAYLELLVEGHERVWVAKDEANDGDWFDELQKAVEPIVSLLDATKSVDIARHALELGVHPVLARYRWQDRDRYRMVLALARHLDLSEDTDFASTLCFVIDKFPNARAANTVFQPMLHALAPLEAGLRRHFFSWVIHELPKTRQSIRQVWPRFTRYMPRLARFIRTEHVHGARCSTIVTSALAIDRAHADPDKALSYLDWLLRFLAEQAAKREHSYGNLPAFKPWVDFGSVVAGGDLPRFQAIVRAAMQHDLEYDSDRLYEGIEALGKLPTLHAPLADTFPRQPNRCIKLMARLSLAPQLGKEMLAPLERLAPDEQPIPPDWQPLVDLAPEQASTVGAYLHAQRILGESLGVPPGVRRALDQPRKLAGELAYLERRLVDEPERTELAARAQNLRARLEDMDGMMLSVRQEVSESIHHMAAEAQFAAAERQVLACYQARLETLAGVLPPEMSLNDDLLNATLLATSLTTNRRLLLQLLRAYVSGEHFWPEKHPANAAFLEGLESRGVDSAAWLDAHPRSYICKGAAGGHVRLYLERDPLSILQMGNYFDTCLSFDGINAFSTVANSCELNKRVIYARDGAGKVVGRKLIGISGEGKLVGFRTYSALAYDEGGEELHAIFRSYASDFAERCKLTLADEGTVPTLFASDWYDDGVVSWYDIDDGKGSKTKRARADSNPRPSGSEISVSKNVAVSV